MSSTQELPRWARQLGHAGLVPFVGGALLVHLVWPEAHPYAVLALAAYAAYVINATQFVLKLRAARLQSDAERQRASAPGGTSLGQATAEVA